MTGIFVTGTDTGIGKTALSALLLAELRRRGINAAPMKPVQTGCCVATTGARQEARGTSDSSCLSVPDLDYSLSMASMSVASVLIPCSCSFFISVVSVVSRIKDRFQ